MTHPRISFWGVQPFSSDVALACLSSELFFHVGSRSSSHSARRNALFSCSQSLRHLFIEIYIQPLAGQSLLPFRLPKSEVLELWKGSSQFPDWIRALLIFRLFTLYIYLDLPAIIELWVGNVWKTERLWSRRPNLQVLKSKARIISWLSSEKEERTRKAIW